MPKISSGMASIYGMKSFKFEWQVDELGVHHPSYASERRVRLTLGG